MRKLMLSGLVVILGTSLSLAQTPGIDTTGQRVTKYPKVDTTAKKTPQYQRIDTTGQKPPIKIKMDTQKSKPPSKAGIDTTQKATPIKMTGISLKEIQPDKNFQLSEVKFNRLNKDVISVSGKLTNKSGRNYSKSATFNLFIFDQKESLLGNGTIKVSGFNHNGTVSFTGKIYSRVDHNQIGKYKIQFVKGN